MKKKNLLKTIDMDFSFHQKKALECSDMKTLPDYILTKSEIVKCETHPCTYMDKLECYGSEKNFLSALFLNIYTYDMT